MQRSILRSKCENAPLVDIDRVFKTTLCSLRTPTGVSFFSLNLYRYLHPLCFFGGHRKLVLVDFLDNLAPAGKHNANTGQSTHTIRKLFVEGCAGNLCSCERTIDPSGVLARTGKWVPDTAVDLCM